MVWIILLIGIKSIMFKRICVIGAGKWGINHINTLEKLNVLSGIVELNNSLHCKLKKMFPEVLVFSRIEDAIKHKFDGFTIATPASTHFEIAKKIIKSKSHVLIEKPITTNLEDALKLNDLAKLNKVRIMVGHSLLFHPAYIKIKEMIKSKKLGELQYLYSNRVNLGTIINDENVLWSFAPHDIALFQFLIGKKPKNIESVGIDILQSNIHDTTITTIKYPGKIMGHIFVSWLHPFKEHRFVVVGSKGMIHFEDSSKDKLLTFYDKNIEWKNNIPNISKKNGINIKYKSSLPLENEMKYFINMIDDSKLKKANGNHAIEVMEILTIASKKLLKD